MARHGRLRSASGAFTRQVLLCAFIVACITRGGVSWVPYSLGRNADSRTIRRSAANAALDATVAETLEQKEGADEDARIIDDLLLLAAEKDGGEALRARVDADFAKITPEDLSDIQMQVRDGNLEDAAASPAYAVVMAIQAAVDMRMTSARNAIEDLIKNGLAQGDIHIGIRKCLKQADSPLPLLIVLQLNIEQAQKEGDENKLRALMHIYSTMNEEMEKKVSRVRALLNKLLRMDDPNIRSNILRHHLGPTEVAAAPSPFDDEEETQPQLTAALVPPSRLASAMADLVNDVDRQMKAAVGEGDEARFETLDRIRTIAKEARIIIGELYGDGEMDKFGADLTPAFNTLMTWKAAQEAMETPPEGDSSVQEPTPAA